MKTKGTVRLISIILLLIISVLLIYYFHIIRDTGEVFSHFFYIPIIISILWWSEKGLLTTLFLIVLLCTSNFFRETPNIIHDFYRSIPFIIVSIIAYSINEKLIKARIKSFQTLGDLEKSKVGYEHLFTMLRLMCDNLPELIWAKDLEGKYIFVNKSCCENLLNAKDTDEPIGKTDLYFAERKKNSHSENPEYNTFGGICTDSDLKTIESKKQTNSDETGYIQGVYTILNVSKAPFWYNNNIIGTIGCARDVTIERKYEKILTESEERFRSLYENTTIGLYRTTPDGKILLANPALVSMLGYNNFDELAQLNLEKEGFGSGYSRHMFLEKIEKKGEIKGLESAWEKKDGTTIFIRESAKVIHDSNNQVVYYEGTVEDITERKQVEDILRQSKEFVETIFNNIYDALCVIDPTDFTIISANKAFLDTYRLEEKEIIGKYCYEVTHNRTKPCGVPDNVCPLVETLKTGKHSSAEHILYDSFGRESYFDISTSPIKNEKGEIYQIIHRAQNITQRKKIENALEQSEEKYRTMIEQSNDMIWTLDIDGNLTFFNRQSEEISGHLFKDWEGKSFAPLIVEEDLPIVMEVFQKTLKGKSQRYEVRINRYDEHIIILSVNTAPILKNNKVVGTVSFGRDITVQKRAEEELKSLSCIVEQSTEGMALADLNGNIVFSNIAWCEMHGYDSPKDYLGKNLAIFHSKEQLDNDVIPFNEEVKKHGTYSGEVGHIRKDDTPCPALMNTTCLKDEHGKPFAFAGIAKDITERRQAEEIIRKSEAKYRLLAENTIDCVWKMDKDLKFTYINQSILSMLGFTQEEWMGSALKEHCSVKELQHFMSIVEDELQKEDTYSSIFELYLFHKDGREIPLEVMGKILFDKNKEITGFQGNARDITERKRAEQIQKVLYNISNAVITTDNLEKLIGLIQKELGTVIDTTNFYVALYDHKNDTLSVPFFADEKNEFTTFPAGKTLTYYIIKTQEPLFATKEILKKLEKSGDIESFGTDSEIWLGVPLKIEGEVTGVLAVQSYSDENAFNESDMKMLEFVSDHISISIDRKKTEEELIKSKEKAEENDRLKTAFLTNMSHEIRTPMNGIIGFADLLKKANYIDKKEFDFYANIIVDSSKQLLNIVNDILDISKIETGQIDLYEEEVALNSILNDILSFFEIKAKEKGLSLNLITDLSIVNPIILVDISKLKQIIFNVIGNAFKFTEKGSIDFGYKIKGSQLEFFVKDSGIGIPKKYHKDIFNRFNKVENDSTQLFGGTGLGLAICTGLVEKMGGRIWVESDPDSLSGSQGKTGGAEFYFTIPYYKTSTQTKVSKLQGNITESNLADFTILVVEDEKNSAIYLKEILSNRKIKQLLAKDGKQAIEIFKKNSDIDLILMDIKLPVMDGYAATREIKKINSEIPVIAQTAYAMLGDKEKSLKAGCDDYISKPISEENLISLLEKYLKK